MTWRGTVLSLFPDMLPGPGGASLLGKALEKNLWSLDVRDIREHGPGKQKGHIQPKSIGELSNTAEPAAQSVAWTMK